MAESDVFVDTGAWYAYVDRNDPDHAAVCDLIDSASRPLVTSNFVLDETLTLVQARIGSVAAIRLGERLLSGRLCLIERATEEDERRAFALFRRFAGVRASFTDCTSFALMKRLHVRTAFALDSHFAQAGFEVVPGG